MTRWAYIKWGVIIVFVGVAVTSFLTQGALALKDEAKVFFAGSPDNQAIANIVAAHTSQLETSRNSGLGSDDSAAGESNANGQFNGGSLNGRSPNSSGSSQYTLQNQEAFPRLTAGAYLAADLETGEIIVEHNGDLVAPIASVSKLMTALIAEEQMDLQKTAIVSQNAYNTFGTEGELHLGEQIRLYDLMYPLLMESSNDGAEVVADAYSKGHDAFMAEMNKKASALGMTHTYYEDPSGLNPKNVSSVEDLLKLGRYVYETKPVIFNITRVRQYSLLKHTWKNANAFLKYDTFIGGKNGYIDESKKTTVSLFDIPLARGGYRKVVVVLLKSDDREGDGIKIVNFLKKNAYFDLNAQ